MINNEIIFEKSKGTVDIECICDYCGQQFIRKKKYIIDGRKNLSKDSCKQCIPLKIKEIFLLKYGVSNPSKNEVIKNKRKETCLKKYGVENSFLSKEVQQKIAKTNLEKYGVERPLQSSVIREKTQQTHLERYGVKNPFESKDIQDKIKETNIVKYGVSNPAANKEIRNKIKQTNLERYGFESPLQNKSIRSKIKNTILKKYGVEYIHESEEIVAKIKTTNLQKYGVEFPIQSKLIQEKAKNTVKLKYGVRSILSVSYVKEKIIHTNLDKYGQSRPKFIYGKTQKEIETWLNSFGFKFKTVFINGQEIDLYDENIKIGIEYCGLYWHNETKRTDPLYHYNKYLVCQKENIKLITLFEDEWIKRELQCKNYFLNELAQYKIIGDCYKINEIQKEEFNSFCNAYDIKGRTKELLIAFAIFINNEIIGVIGLCKSKYCEKIIINGFCFNDIHLKDKEKILFTSCIEWAKIHNYKFIDVNINNRFPQHELYEELGFIKNKEIKPNYMYVVIKNPNIRLSKMIYKSVQNNFISEEDWMTKTGHTRLWDCGKTKYRYNICS